MKREGVKLAAVGAVMLVMMSVPAYAGEWKQDAAGWWYESAGGSYLANQWEWIDGKCYYFGADGYMLTNTTTPDGSAVNGDGAWVVDGKVQGQTNDPEMYEKKVAKYIEEAHLDTSILTYNNENALSYTISIAYMYARNYYLTYIGDINPNIDPKYTKHQERELIDAVNAEIKAFVNSFDWQNSSETIKAAKVWERVAIGYHGNRYSLSECNYTTKLSVLVTNVGACENFAEAFDVLAKCVGLETVKYDPAPIHIANLVKVEEQWYKLDPTKGNENFQSILNCNAVDFETEYNRFAKEVYDEANGEEWYIMGQKFKNGEITEAEYDAWAATY